MAIPKRLEEIIEEQKALKEASLWGDIAAVGATALAVGELGLNPVADAAAGGLDAAAIGGAVAEGAGAAGEAAGAGEAAAGAGEASSGASGLSKAWRGYQNYNTVKHIVDPNAGQEQAAQTPQQSQPLDSYDTGSQFATQGPANPEGANEAGVGNNLGTVGFKRVAFLPMTTVPMEDSKWLSPAPQVFNPSAPVPSVLDAAKSFLMDHPDITKSVAKGVGQGIGQNVVKMFEPKPSTAPTVEPLTVPQPQRTPEPSEELKTTERTPEDSREVNKETETEAKADSQGAKPPAGPKAPGGTGTEAPSEAPEEKAPPEPAQNNREPRVPKSNKEGYGVPEAMFVTRGPINPQTASVNSDRLFQLLQEDYSRIALTQNESKPTTWDTIEPTVWY